MQVCCRVAPSAATSSSLEAVVSVEGKDVTGQSEPEELRGKQCGAELGAVGADALDHGQRQVDGDELAQHRGRGGVGERGVNQGDDRVAVLVTIPVAR